MWWVVFLVEVRRDFLTLATRRPTNRATQAFLSETRGVFYNGVTVQFKPASGCSMRIRRAFCALLVCAAGCSASKSSSPLLPTVLQTTEAPSAQSDVRAEALGADEQSERSTVTATFRDGLVVNNWEAYEAAAARLAVSGPNPVTLEVDVSAATSPGPSPNVAGPRDVKLWLGRYLVRLSKEPGYVGGCVNRHGVPHLGLMLRDSVGQREVVNLHLASWQEGTRRCFAVYNSATGWCKRICGPTKSEMTRLIAEALIAAGITVTVAYVVAQLVVPAIVVFLAL